MNSRNRATTAQNTMQKGHKQSAKQSKDSMKSAKTAGNIVAMGQHLASAEQAIKQFLGE